LHSEAICEPVLLNTKEQLVNCETYIQAIIESMDTVYIRMIYDDAFNLELPEQPHIGKLKISNSFMEMQLEDINDGARFSI
jgi:hypothetical protein